MLTAEQLIAALNLRPLPREGGYYRETYRSSQRLPTTALSARYAEDKSAGTAIYYLLTADTFSALHRLPTDEVFHFYLGSPVEMLQLWPDGTGRMAMLGTGILAGQHPQLVVPSGVWQGSCLAGGGDFALLGTTMAPGFDFTDYEAGERAALVPAYPSYREWIERLTRESDST
jgi:predicted cupin superfamily sugar epimerase